MARFARITVSAAALAGSLCLVVPAAHASTTTTAPRTAAARCSQAKLPLPDPACTPGATNPDVTQNSIGSTICTPGWTKTIRPPTSYTNQLKKQGIADYGYSDTDMSNYEEDHFLPLELGGAPRDPRNLWPEPHDGDQNSYSKDSVENAVKKAVCAGKAQLAAAQHAMLTDWTTAKAVLGIG
ncbi:hypothetical protein [Amycolatopsis sp. CA-230715]|uniref:hypothetical protein n=1 Tax=Amycolatopsis sp. CA-230715 TaxID=2745196 RepID=UPI001C02CA84|nr:hypothetical protein [Amycolatopsis sp. CA-230715]QWF81101.1 hypothetical protein HUW46_04527 [Amycolatopsis sp. CA-230715]